MFDSTDSGVTSVDDADAGWEPDYASVPSLTVVPEAAWAGARTFEAGDPESGPELIPVPDWFVIDGEPTVRVGAYAPKDAWEQAAVWAQGQVVDLELRRRGVERDQIVALLAASSVSMRDLESRYGLRRTADDHVQASRVFHREMALLLGVTPNAVAARVATGETARRLLPATWAVFTALACPWRAVQVAVDEVDGLDPETRAAYDTTAAALVASVPASRLARRLRVLRERLQDDTATQRAKTTAQARQVRFTEGRDGSGCLTITGPVVTLRAIDQALTKAAIAAKTDDEDRTVTQLRFDIVTDLTVEGVKQHADPAWGGWLVPKRKGVDCVAAVTIPALAWTGVTSEQATLEGVGPIDVDTALTVAAQAPSLVRILTDPVTGVRRTLDRAVYSPPADLRRWVHYRDQRCRFPGCNRAATDCDIDHATEWHHHGLTNDDNLVCLCRADHTAKTLRLFQEQLRTDGTVDWTSPWNRHHTDPPPHPADPAPRSLTSTDPDEPTTTSWRHRLRTLTHTSNTDPDQPAPF